MLTAKQQRFVEEYVVDFNASDAARRAGYSEKTARAIGAENLTKPDIARAIRQRQEATSEKIELTREFVINGLMDLAQNAQAESARVRAFELLGKHLALFTDRLEVTNITRSMLEQELMRLEAQLADN